jgi:hypothetical protein
MFVSQKQAVAVAKAISKTFSAIPDRPEDFKTHIPTATVHDGGMASYRAVHEAESERRARIAGEPDRLAAKIDALKLASKTAKADEADAGKDKFAVLDARYKQAVAEADLAVAQAELSSAKTVARADTEAADQDNAAIMAQAAAEQARAAVEAVEQSEQQKVAAASDEREDAVAAAKKKQQEDYEAVRKAEVIARAEAV